MFFSQAATLGFHREVQSPERDLVKREKEKKKDEGNEPPRRTGSGSIDRWVGLLARAGRTSDVLFVPSRNFRGKTSPVRVRILQHIPSLIRSVLFPNSSSYLPTDLSLFHLSLTRFHNAAFPIPLCLLSTSALPS